MLQLERHHAFFRWGPVRRLLLKLGAVKVKNRLVNWACPKGRFAKGVKRNGCN